MNRTTRRFRTVLATGLAGAALLAGTAGAATALPAGTTTNFPNHPVITLPPSTTKPPVVVSICVRHPEICDIRLPNPGTNNPGKPGKPGDSTVPTNPTTTVPPKGGTKSTEPTTPAPIVTANPTFTG